MSRTTTLLVRVGAPLMAKYESHSDIPELDPDTYFAQARSWDEDRIALLHQSQRRAWMVAGASLVVALLSVGAVIGLTPLKRTDTYLVRVDGETGMVEKMVLHEGPIPETMREAVVKAHLARYVTERESYSLATLQRAFDVLTYMTAPWARAELREAWDFANPDAPYRRYGAKGKASVEIKSRTLLNENVGQVRYIKTETIDGVSTRRHWIATIEFTEFDGPQSEAERDVNPLRIGVTSFRRDPESEVKR